MLITNDVHGCAIRCLYVMLYRFVFLCADVYMFVYMHLPCTYGFEDSSSCSVCVCVSVRVCVRVSCMFVCMYIHSVCTCTLDIGDRLIENALVRMVLKMSLLRMDS